ncbi:MAG: hypothetical protein R6V03_11075 [Kiritimatiellia bacterium]
MKYGVKYIAALTAAIACVCAAGAASLDVEAQDWVLTDAEGGARFSTASEGYTSVDFPEKYTEYMPTYSAGTLLADPGVSDGAFAGDYDSAGAAGVMFDVMGTGELPQNAILYIKTSNGHKWYNKRIQVSAEAEIWTQNGISLDRSAGWIGVGDINTDAIWQDDLQFVKSISLRFAQRGTAEQSYSVDNFRLAGAGSFDYTAATFTMVEQLLKNRFGVTSVEALSEKQKAEDSDGDGMPDYLEILLEYDENHMKSLFAAQVVEVTDDGITIRWPCVAGYRYNVFRSGNLFSEFELLQDAKDLEAVQTGYMSYTDVTATGSGPFYYKVKAKP